MDASKCKPAGPGPEQKRMAEECKRDIKQRARFAQGLKALAESGASKDRPFAKAALGETDACAPLAKSAMDACMGGGTPAAPTPRVGATGAEAPPARGTPAAAPTRKPGT